METEICYPIIMANKRNDTPCILNFPDLYAFIAWSTRQIISNYFVLLRGSGFRVGFFLLIVVSCTDCLSDLTLGLFSAHLQIHLHLLYTFFSGQSSIYSRPRIIILRSTSCTLCACRHQWLICFFITSIAISTLVILIVASASRRSIIVVSIFNCLVGLGGSPHNAIDNVFVLIKNLDYSVVRVVYSTTSSLSALLFY